MRKYVPIGMAALLLSLPASGQTFTEWHDASVNAVNRAPMHTDYFAYETTDLAERGERESSTYYMFVMVFPVFCELFQYYNLIQVYLNQYKV